MPASGSLPRIDVIIPARNEEESILKVLQALPRTVLRHIIVSNNGSTDRTALLAHEAGATVIEASIPGYGNACLAAMEYLDTFSSDTQPDLVVFLDADYSDFPEELPALTAPILEHGFDLVIGSRVLGDRQQGALLAHQMFGNKLATMLIRILYGYRFSDLGPFRAVRWSTLKALDMRDRTYGWTVEMQVKAAKRGLKCMEVPVSYRKRIGTSKVSGTVKGTVLAGYKILYTIFKNL